MIDHNLETVQVPVGDLKTYPGNARRGDLPAIKKSIELNGFYTSLTVQRSTGYIIAGNHRYMAAKELGVEEVPVQYLDVDDKKARAIALVDNKTADDAEMDVHALIALLEGVDSDDDWESTGYGPEDLASLLDEANDADLENSGVTGDDDPPALRADPISKVGDIFILGGHRVICGSSTEPETLEALMGGDKADLMWTDPPDGVEYVGKTKDALTIQNDGAVGLPALLTDAFGVVIRHLAPGAPCYVAHPDTERVTFETCFKEAGFILRQNLVWVKNTLVLGHSDYHYKHEPILYGFAPDGEGRLGRGGERWYGDDSQTTVFNVDKPSANRFHPTMKPVELIGLHLDNSLRRGGVVLDPFAGSGSTLIAAHTHGSRACVVELDPRYVDVICARYQGLTGETPERTDGTLVDFEGYYREHEESQQ